MKNYELKSMWSCQVFFFLTVLHHFGEIRSMKCFQAAAAASTLAPASGALQRRRTGSRVGQKSSSSEFKVCKFRIIFLTSHWVKKVIVALTLQLHCGLIWQTSKWIVICRRCCELKEQFTPRENAATLFYCEAPEMFCGPKHVRRRWWPSLTLLKINAVSVLNFCLTVYVIKATWTEGWTERLLWTLTTLDWY